MILYYLCSDGTKIDLLDDVITAETPETLLEHKWNYKTISGVNGLGRVKSFFKDSVERSLKLNIMADDKNEFNEIMEKLHICFEKDVRTLKPGRIYWNDFYIEVFIFASKANEFDENFEYVELELTVLSCYDYWIREKAFNYLSCNAEELIDAGIDFPFDYSGFDYLRSDAVEVIDNNCITSANFELKFFGPFTSPSVMINGIEYELQDLELDEDEYASINSLTKKIIKVSKSGEKENVFHLRKDNSIFTPLAAGKISVIRPKELQVSITVFDERGEPIWI